MDSRTALLNASRLKRRIAAILLPALVATLAGATALGAYATLQSRGDALAAKRAELGRLQTILASMPDAQAADLGAPAGGGGPEFLSGGSEALVQAAFQARLNQIASASGMEVIAVGNTPIDVRNGARFAGLRASLSGTNDEVVETIFAIETSEPYLTIRSARINAYSAAPDAPGDGPQELLLQLQFEGALAPEGEAAGPPGEAD